MVWLIVERHEYYEERVRDDLGYFNSFEEAQAVGWERMGNEGYWQVVMLKPYHPGRDPVAPLPWVQLNLPFPEQPEGSREERL